MSFEVTTADRFRGCLLGGAIGDALGAPIEFHSLSEIRAMYGRGGIDTFCQRLRPHGRDHRRHADDAVHRRGASPCAVTVIEKGITDPVTVIYLAYLRWLSTQGWKVHANPDFGSPNTGWLITNDVLHASRAPGNTCLSSLGSRRTRESR